MTDTKQDKTTAEPETFTPKVDITWPQRDGTHVVIAPEGVALPMKEAKRLAKAGALDLATGKMPAKKDE